MIETKLIHGDCLEKLKELPDCSVDSVVTDPPYGLSFMGKKWDYDVPSVEVWKECLRVLKPGGHLLAFAGTRTQHRMAVRIEDAGFEIRDMIAWVYGSGFPKSLDVSKAIDKAAGALGTQSQGANYAGGDYAPRDKTMRSDYGYTYTPATAEARQWSGWGTALKPALEPITVARKPLGEKTVAANVLEHGTGAINVDGCRVGTDGGTAKGNPPKDESNGIYGHGINGACDILDIGKGRWPANLIHDGSDETAGLLGEAARFFYCAKASKADRNEGLETFEVKRVNDGRASGLSSGMPEKAMAAQQNHHPTVKPTDLMRYLCRLVTPPGGIVLDPFMGSGSTGKAAELEGFNFIGIEREESYMEIAEARINSAKTPA
jgi:DNA modification methylase